MKTLKLFYLTTLLLACIQLQAQTQQGSMMIGGNAGFANSSQGDFSTTVVSINPSIGYFVIDKLAVGASLGISFFSGDLFEGTSFGVGPFARYYFTDGSNIRPFGQAGFDWSSFKPKEGDSQSNTGFDIGVGASLFLNDHVAIDGIIGYNSMKADGEDDSTNTFGITFGVQAFFGGDSGN